MPVAVYAVPLAGAVNPNARALLSHRTTRTTEKVVDDTETFGQAPVSDFSRTDLPAEDQPDQLDVDLEGDEFDVVAPTDELEPIYEDLIALGPLEEGDAVFALKVRIPTKLTGGSDDRDRWPHWFLTGGVFVA